MIQQLKLQLPSPIQEIHDSLYSEKGIRVFVKRDDLIHPMITGNKWRKLKKYIEIFENSGKKGILSFGGAYSNHLMALASIGKELRIPTIGIIRGEELTPNSNLQLNWMQNAGMILKFISREEYRNKKIPSDIPLNEFLVIPEGGFSAFGVESIKALADEINKENFDYIIAAVGTGTTLIGLSKYLKNNILGILSLKNLKEIKANEWQMNQANSIQFFEEYSPRAYGKKEVELEKFCVEFSTKTKIPVERIYTGKMFYALNDLILKEYFPKGSRILAIHTGGIYPTEPSSEMANNF